MLFFITTKDWSPQTFSPNNWSSSPFMSSQQMAANAVLLVLLALSFSLAVVAFDPQPLLDFCVAQPNSQGIYFYLYSYNFHET